MDRETSVVTPPAVHARRTARSGRTRRLLLAIEPDTTYGLGGGEGGAAPVTIDTPTHGQRCVLADALHRFDGPVTRAALDAAQHVLAVVEVHEIGKRVHLGPRNRAPLLHGLFQPLDVACPLLQERVAVHADVERRNAGVAAPRGGKMAIHTRNLQFTGVKLVREGNRLFRRVALMHTDALQGARRERPRTGHRNENQQEYESRPAQPQWLCPTCTPRRSMALESGNRTSETALVNGSNVSSASVLATCNRTRNGIWSTTATSGLILATDAR